MKKVLFMLLLAVHIASAKAQTNEIYDKNIASLQVVAGQQWLSLPVVKLGGHSPNDRLYISFDDLTHSYHRYTYKIEHCEADWTVSSQLFPSDYIAGFQDGNTIEYGEESINTNTLYTHYTLCIPNEQCAIKMSGNYKLTVFDEDDGNRPMFTACFMVLEPIASISLEVTTNTDIDINKAHQQVSMQVNYGNLTVTDPASQIKTVVMQNRRWDNARINVSAKYATTDGLKWEHCRDLIFQAGNEYHKYEILDVAYPTMGIDSIVWDGSNYHVYPYPCEPRPNYLYDEDANGAFYIRNSDNIENDIASDYVFVHYTLKTPEKYDGNIYVNGAWTNDKFTPEFQMKYDELDKRYTTTVMQKQGYYSYQFILIGRDGTSRVVPSEGCFYQTENKYQALVYYRGRGERTDRLVGFQEVQFK
jgi:hypothetical protein